MAVPQNIVYGYVVAFNGLVLIDNGIYPYQCALRAGRGARVISLATGAAYSYAGNLTTGIGPSYPIEQTMEVLLQDEIFSGGNQAADKLDLLEQQLYQQGFLVVASPGGSLRYCTAIFDDIVAQGEGNMEAGKSWEIYDLIFQQMDAWL